MTYQFRRLGTDLEVFLKDSEGRPVPVCGLLGGTKEHPRVVMQDILEGFAVQEDNVMAEFNVPPAESYGQWHRNLAEMKKYLTYFFEAKGLVICPEASMRFLPEQLQSEQAKTFGCDPDFNIWAMSQNEIDRSNPELETLRTAGGHVHIEFTVNDQPCEPADLVRVVKLLDLYLGVPSVAFDPDTLRRSIYGRAGSFRPKPYGVEYRVLSSLWFSNEDYWEWVMESVVRAFRHLRGTGSEERVDEWLEKEAAKIQETINTSSKEHLEYFQNNYDVWVPNLERKKKPKRRGQDENTIQAMAADLVGLRPFNWGAQQVVFEEVDMQPIQAGEADAQR